MEIELRNEDGSVWARLSDGRLVCMVQQADGTYTELKSDKPTRKRK